MYHDSVKDSKVSETVISVFRSSAAVDLNLNNNNNSNNNNNNNNNDDDDDDDNNNNNKKK